MNHNFTSDTATKTLNITHYFKIHMLHTHTHTQTNTQTCTHARTQHTHACIHTGVYAYTDIYVYTQRGRHAQTSHLAMHIPTHNDGSGHWLYIRLLQQKVTHTTQFLKREGGRRKGRREGGREGGRRGREGEGGKEGRELGNRRSE